MLTLECMIITRKWREEHAAQRLYQRRHLISGMGSDMAFSRFLHPAYNALSLIPVGACDAVLTRECREGLFERGMACKW